jgi:serine/threonine-protein kinase
MRRNTSSLLDHRYQIGEILRQDTHERHLVYAARHVELAIPVRVLVHDCADIATARACATRFGSRVPLAIGMRHPVLPRVRDCFRQGSRYYVVIDDIAGETLSARLARKRPTPVAEALSIGLQLCEALAYLDATAPALAPLGTIASENLVLRPSGGVALAEVPVCRWLGLADSTPAQAPGSSTVSAPPSADGWAAGADLCSVAALLYTMLAGRPPILRDGRYAPLGELAPHLSAELVAAVERGLQTNPGAPFRSAFDFGVALASAAYAALPEPDPLLALAAGTPSAPVPMPTLAALPQVRHRTPAALFPSVTGRGPERGAHQAARVQWQLPLLRTGERALAALSSALHLSA